MSEPPEWLSAVGATCASFLVISAFYDRRVGMALFWLAMLALNIWGVAT